MTAIRFKLNGEPRTVDGVAPTVTALDWIRGHARLTGTKEGCAEGDCGACTIVIRRPGEARPAAVNACLMMLPQLDQCDVLTIEGLSDERGKLHPVQQALVDAHATQCGFCTPGFAMAMVAFREGGEPPEDTRIHEALAGNLCRCTGYRSIVDACRTMMPPSVATQAHSEDAVVAADQTRPLAYAASGQHFHAPASLPELLAQRADHPDALLLGGGTDLGLRVAKDREPLPRVIATRNVAALHAIDITRDTLAIGGAATYTAALPFLDAHFPAFGQLVRRIGSRQIRNLGTLAGNLVTASPIGDTLPCLVALDASVELQSQARSRTLKLADFILGYRRTALAADEVLTRISIPLLRRDEAFAVYKLSKRFDQDISAVVAAFLLRREDTRVTEFRAAFGGMAAQVKRAAALERAVAGQPWSGKPPLDAETLLAHDFAPMSDHRGTAAYRLQAAAGLVRRFQLEAAGAEAPIRLEAL